MNLLKKYNSKYLTKERPAQLHIWLSKIVSDLGAGLAILTLGSHLGAAKELNKYKARKHFTN